MKELKVGIVDDHDIIRFAVSELLKRHAFDFPVKIVFDAENGKQALQAAKEHPPDLVIMDIAMPEMDGIETTRQIKNIFPHCQIIILSGKVQPFQIRQLLQAGVSGYVHKSRVLKELCEAIKSVVKERPYFSSEVVHHILQNYIKEAPELSAKYPKLNKREILLIKLMVEGKGTKEIARQLGMSIKAVESARYRLLHKLGIDNTAELIKFAIREGLAPLEGVL